MAKEPIRVLRIVNRFNLGGPVYNVTFLSAFLPNEFETLLCGGKHEKGEGDALFIPESYGLNPQIIESFQRSVNPLKDRVAVKEIREIIRKFKPHIVHTHASKAGAVGRLAASKEHVPIIVHTFHGHVFHSYFGKFKTFIYRFAERKLAKKTDAIIAISEIQKTELVSKYKISKADKFRVIPLGFDLRRFKENKEQKRTEFRSKYGIEENELVIGIVGRLVPIKNHDLFIDAVKIASQTTEQKVKAVIIGDGERREELELMAKKAEEESNGKLKFVFTSWIKNVDQALPGLDLLLLTSFNEGTPVSLIEAQAAGVPLISSDVGGVRDVINQNETGFVIAGFHVEKFAETIVELGNDRELRQRMSQNGWNFVEHKFSYTRLVNDMSVLYHELLKKKGLE